MSGINLSDWALKHRSLVVYMMMIAVVGGALSYFRLGRNEDPAFIIKTMVVQAAWPGATVEETMKQVTERLERHLQETPHLDFLRSFTRAGVATVFVNLKGSANAKQVADTWYHVRKTIGDMRHTLPAGVIGPGFNDEFGDTFGIIYGFTSDGFTQRELRDRVEDIRSRLLLVPDVSKIELLGEQDEVIFVEFSTKELAALGIDRSALIAALQSQNIVRPAGTIQTGLESISIRVSGSFQSEQDIANINFSAGGRMLRLSDIAQVRRGYTDPPQPMFRINGKPTIGLAIAMRDGGDILALGANIRKAMAQITANLPIGIEPSLGRGPARCRRPGDPRVYGLADAGDRHHHGGEFHQPGRTTRPDHSAGHTIHAGDRVSDHGTSQHRYAANIAWRADHCARIAGRRCDDHDRCDAQSARRGRQ
ncbi:multidrug efflux pump subunit AcrB [Bradyrhizobium sp. i1.3.6]